MMRALRDLLVDGELRQRMERLGMARAAAFSWRMAAERTLSVYHEVAEAHARQRAGAKVAQVRQ
jgi:glycosyltransferase involved in cell wall biosynthesis